MTSIASIMRDAPYGGYAGDNNIRRDGFLVELHELDPATLLITAVELQTLEPPRDSVSRRRVIVGVAVHRSLTEVWCVTYWNAEKRFRDELVPKELRALLAVLRQAEREIGRFELALEPSEFLPTYAPGRQRYVWESWNPDGSQRQRTIRSILNDKGYRDVKVEFNTVIDQDDDRYFYERGYVPRNEIFLR
jgi:hypothetical protein